MIRNKKPKTPSAILTGDWHLREDTPVCRTDDFWAAQWDKVDQIKQLQRKYDCSVYHSGDLFNHWKPSPYLLNITMQKLPANFRTIYGNHDLPQHNIALSKKCGIDVLKRAKRVEVLDQCHWGDTPGVPSLIWYGEKTEAELRIENEYHPEFEYFPNENDHHILIWHVMTYQGKSPWPGCTDLTAEEILLKYLEFDLIITGHNHKSFTESFTADGKPHLLVNPGSLTRQAADQADHRPCVYLWYADTNTVKPYYLEINKGVVSREHLDRITARDERIEAFVQRLSGEMEIGVNFEESLQRFAQKNKVRKSVMEIVWRAVG